ncbi:MAG TPA: hypothetical protein VFX03_15850, partial [Thermomicrobiales bacterium]|nr:hypothetical protein [Thermomicrobiales bacterium]
MSVKSNGVGGAAPDGPPHSLEALADFTASRRMITLAFMAAVIGVIGAVLAVVLLRAIDFFTNIF